MIDIEIEEDRGMIDIEKGKEVKDKEKVWYEQANTIELSDRLTASNIRKSEKENQSSDPHKGPKAELWRVKEHKEGGRKKRKENSQSPQKKTVER